MKALFPTKAPHTMKAPFPERERGLSRARLLLVAALVTSLAKQLAVLLLGLRAVEDVDDELRGRFGRVAVACTGE